MTDKIPGQQNQQANLTPKELQYLKDKETAAAKDDAAEFKPLTSAGPVDAARSRHTPYDPATASKKNFDEKIYMFPESFNALRVELMHYWPHLWQHVGWVMANNAQEFVIRMNDALDMRLQFDTAKVDSICKQFLNKLRSVRGVSKIH